MYLSNLLSANFFVKRQIRKEKTNVGQSFLSDTDFLGTISTLSNQNIQDQDTNFQICIEAYLPLDWNVGWKLRLI